MKKLLFFPLFLILLVLPINGQVEVNDMPTENTLNEYTSQLESQDYFNKLFSSLPLQTAFDGVDYDCTIPRGKTTLPSANSWRYNVYGVNYWRWELWNSQNKLVNGAFQKGGEATIINNPNPSLDYTLYSFDCKPKLQIISCIKSGSSIYVDGKKIATDGCSFPKMAVAQTGFRKRYECKNTPAPSGWLLQPSLSTSNYNVYLGDSCSDGIVCSSEVKQCPDGSNALKDSHCNFLPCPIKTKQCPDGSTIGEDLECPKIPPSEDPCSKCSTNFLDPCDELECTSIGKEGQCKFYDIKGSALNYCSSTPPSNVCCRNLDTGVSITAKIECDGLATATTKFLEVDKSFCGETPSNKTKQCPDGSTIGEDLECPKTPSKQLTLTQEEYDISSSKAILASSCNFATDCNTKENYSVKCIVNEETKSKNKKAFESEKSWWCSVGLADISIGGVFKLTGYLLGTGYGCKNDIAEGACIATKKQDGGSGFVDSLKSGLESIGSSLNNAFGGEAKTGITGLTMGYLLIGFIILIIIIVKSRK